MVLRLAILLREPKSEPSPASPSLQDEQAEPNETNEAEERVERGQQHFEANMTDEITEDKQ